MKNYVIISDTEKDEESGMSLFWNNVDGWVDLVTCDKFTEEESKTLNPPIGGRFVYVDW
jgi:hypothetical protein